MRLDNLDILLNNQESFINNFEHWNENALNCDWKGVEDIVEDDKNETISKRIITFRKIIINANYSNDFEENVSMTDLDILAQICSRDLCHEYTTITKEQKDRIANFVLSNKEIFYGINSLFNEHALHEGGIYCNLIEGLVILYNGYGIPHELFMETFTMYVNVSRFRSRIMKEHKIDENFINALIKEDVNKYDFSRLATRHAQHIKSLDVLMSIIDVTLTSWSNHYSIDLSNLGFDIDDHALRTMSKGRPTILFDYIRYYSREIIGYRLVGEDNEVSEIPKNFKCYLPEIIWIDTIKEILDTEYEDANEKYKHINSMLFMVYDIELLRERIQSIFREEYTNIIIDVIKFSVKHCNIQDKYSLLSQIPTELVNTTIIDHCYHNDLCILTYGNEYQYLLRKSKGLDKDLVQYILHTNFDKVQVSSNTNVVDSAFSIGSLSINDFYNLFNFQTITPFGNRTILNIKYMFVKDLYYNGMSLEGQEVIDFFTIVSLLNRFVEGDTSIESLNSYQYLIKPILEDSSLVFEQNEFIVQLLLNITPKFAPLIDAEYQYMIEDYLVFHDGYKFEQEIDEDIIGLEDIREI